MAGTQTFNEQFPAWDQNEFDDTYTSPTPYSLWVITTGPSRCDQLIASSSDTVDHTITVILGTAVNGWGLGTYTIPAGAGTVLGVPPVNLFAAMPATLQGGFAMDASGSIRGVLDSTPSSGTKVNIAAIGGLL